MLTTPLEEAHDLMHEIEAYPEGALVMHEGDGFLPRVFGPACTRLRDALHEKSASSVSELARRLGRERTSVQKDVSFLTELGLLRRERRGRDVAVHLVERPILVTRRAP